MGHHYVTSMILALLLMPFASNVSAEPPSYDGVKDAAETIDFQTPKHGRALGDSLTGLLYRPDGEGPFPAIVALHGAGGIFPYQLWWARYLSQQGYVVLMVDSYCKRGVLCEHSSGDDDPARGRVMRNWDRIPVPQRVADAYGALDHLKSLSYVEGDKIGVVGWSWGGSAALYALNLEKRLRVSSTFAGAVAFYPNYKYMTRSRHWGGYKISKPVLILYGKDDVLESTESYAEALNAAVPAVIVAYDGGVRKFDEVGEPRMKEHPKVGSFPKAFLEPAFRDSMGQVQRFFLELFK